MYEHFFFVVPEVCAIPPVIIVRPVLVTIHVLEGRGE